VVPNDMSLCIIQSNAEATSWSKSTLFTVIIRAVVLRWCTVGLYAMCGFVAHSISLLCCPKVAALDDLAFIWLSMCSFVASRVVSSYVASMKALLARLG
jgi:hypothetical protein